MGLIPGTKVKVLKMAPMGDPIQIHLRGYDITIPKRGWRKNNLEGGIRSVIFALIGNQNCGKTTLFNQMTGSNQHVGNFPGVTVDQKMGKFSVGSAEGSVVRSSGNLFTPSVYK